MSKQGLSNPLITAATSAITAKATSKATDKGGEFLSKNAKTIFVTLGAVVLAYFGYKAYKKWRIQKFLDANAHKPDVQAAMIIYKAIHRVNLGFISNWFDIPDGTDVEALNNLAININSLQDVSRAYKIVFGENLHQDIQSDLSSDELLEFYNRLKVNASSQSINAEPVYLIGEDVFARKNTGVITTKAEIINDRWTNTEEFYKKYEYGEKLGKIEAIINDPWQPENTVYIIDVPWSYVEIWVRHDDVENNL
ncbi:hypothetical protein [Mangrovimonas cancribranchiae]|uniref:Uncharacterized protein n=1 Tax=Mangrovimonas cancribranchiae TaxID=3080055 RepID=A0AAU6NWX7_9FLAO